MGRAARWLRGLLGGKKSAEEEEKTHSSTSKEKRRWGFGKSFREKEKDKRTPPLPPYYPSSSAARGDDDVDQNKRAIAVAAATAAVAEAAVAAAQAAAAVVRLTSSSGRSGAAAAAAAGKRYESAAVKIQSGFRAYLARRALRALRGLVKLQALVRGNIVRKQAAETLRCMQALVRVQARTRACRALRADRNHRSKSPGGPHPGPPTPDKYEQAIRSKAMNSNLKRNSSKAASTTRGHDQEQAQPSGWNWLDRWMEERYWDSRESNQSGVVAMSATLDDEKNAKILEVDTGKPNVRRKSSCHHSSSAAASDQNSRSFNTMPDSPSKDSTVAQRSIPSPSSVGMQSLSPLRFPVVDGGEYCESPQFFSAMSRPGSSRRGPFTPAKSDCSRSLFSAFSDYPSYMANTESSRAKVRSQSAPKQRPEFEKLGSVRRGTGHGLPQPSVGSTQKSSSLQSKFANKAYPGSGRLDRLGMPVRI